MRRFKDFSVVVRTRKTRGAVAAVEAALKFGLHRIGKPAGPPPPPLADDEADAGL
ncbi:hypothetical protein J2Z31_004720 [Sinorhizobium kostiense]|uniref:Uncharacterized protein n=1 Tax=Sinorhizobium kostiense TaxID=76747 RepID=A0ABS4R5M2_9HYPH|nr:hypothetical protein [Sinorhizobium kostiense]MBP2238193.1 hypothetical protein [Sinorhizobium kostiense]